MSCKLPWQKLPRQRGKVQSLSGWMPLKSALVKCNIVPNILFHIVTTISSLDLLRCC